MKIDLRKMIREELKNVEKPALNEGIITNIISGMVSLILTGRAKQIDSLIDPIKRRELVKATNDLKRSTENLRKVLESPAVKKEIESAGLTADDFF